MNGKTDLPESPDDNKEKRLIKEAVEILAKDLGLANPAKFDSVTDVLKAYLDKRNEEEEVLKVQLTEPPIFSIGYAHACFNLMCYLSVGNEARITYDMLRAAAGTPKQLIDMIYDQMVSDVKHKIIKRGVELLYESTREEGQYER